MNSYRNQLAVLAIFTLLSLIFDPVEGQRRRRRQDDDTFEKIQQDFARLPTDLYRRPSGPLNRFIERHQKRPEFSPEPPPRPQPQPPRPPRPIDSVFHPNNSGRNPRIPFDVPNARPNWSVAHEHHPFRRIGHKSKVETVEDEEDDVGDDSDKESDQQELTDKMAKELLSIISKYTKKRSMSY